MKYSAQIYADALMSLLDAHPEKESEIMRGFVDVLKTSGDIVQAEKVFSSLKEKIAKKEGKDRVKIYSARPLSSTNKKKIEDVFGGNAHIESVILPEILAGVKIIINNETMIDATLKTKLRLLTQ